MTTATLVQDGKLVRFPRFQDKYQLQRFVRVFFGHIIPSESVCHDHDAPLDAMWASYIHEEPVIVWKASRGFGGKSTMLGDLSLIEGLTGMDVSCLGGSAQQSRRVSEVIEDNLYHTVRLDGGVEIEEPWNALLRDTPNKMQVDFKAGNWFRALTASTRQARGPHPQRLNMDEVDEMDLWVFDSAMGQTMEAGTSFTPGTTISSTYQYPDKTMFEVLQRAEANGWPVYEWCWKENHEDNDGWIPQREIIRKQREVTARMWEIEYDLQEPSIEGRAIDQDALDLMFQRDLGYFEGGPSEYIEIEGPVKGAQYATGADWAKVNDWTVISTFRTDGGMWKLVAFERMRRLPWPHMIERLNIRMDRYKGEAAHDATGVGNVVDDYLRHNVEGIVLVGQRRRDIWSDWIIAMEQGEVEAPHIEWMYREYLYCTVGDLYGQGVDDHPPDSFVAGALAWHMRHNTVDIPAPDFRDLVKTSSWR
jgi:hypothetical protein